MKNFQSYAKYGLTLKFYSPYDQGDTEFKFSPEEINEFLYWREEIQKSNLRYEVKSKRGIIIEQG